MTPDLHEDRTRPVSPGLVARFIDSAESPWLPAFFAAYDAAFILESEKEDLEGFRACLRLNRGKACEALSARYGPYREGVIALFPDGADLPVGAASFIIFAGKDGPVTVSLSYIFVDKDHRRRGLFGTLLHLVREEARTLFETGRDGPLIFIELNDPAEMSAADCARDSGHAGLDQMERLRIWERRGARLVNFPYCQPPLSDSQSSGPELLLGMLGARPDGLPACELLAHLERFFATTVLKGRDPDTIPVAARQLERLRTACREERDIPLTGFDQVLAHAASRRNTGT
ncbi:MAG: GNAT family N-acetyltransferase [Hyphomonas sp.]